ncbi:hypothetical protein DPMN_145464 [Dreissena polymorpha]|uniref:C2H2-type domain-containing protein n=1 Tax=Dreissena polymorpha TaxID=45954 RepID=A0A9D4IYU5_DREPO|nr:hypothetical protein DPMN_145464 [Dreissena polymorpha]
MPASNNNYFEDLVESHDSFYSKAKEQFWCDLCGRGLRDLISLRRHVADHIVDSIADHIDTASQTLRAGTLNNQEPVTGRNVKIKLEDTTLGMLTLCTSLASLWFSLLPLCSPK